MITNIIFFLFSKLLDGVYFVSPKSDFTSGLIDNFRDGLYYAQGLNEWGSALTFFWVVVLTLATFELSYWGMKLVISIINWFRGSGEIKI